MNRKLSILALAATLAGCAASGSVGTDGSTPTPTAARGDGYCDATPVQNTLGRTYSERVVADAHSRSGARTLRVLQPGQVMTLEYNPARLTIVVDDSGNISSARCG